MPWFGRNAPGHPRWCQPNTPAEHDVLLTRRRNLNHAHYFDTALGAGVLAVDAQNKPVLLRYQATNTAGPVFFSALQLLTYTALTDETHRQSLLGHLLSWPPSVTAEATGGDCCTSWSHLSPLRAAVPGAFAAAPQPGMSAVGLLL